MKAGINSIPITSSRSPPHQAFEHRTETHQTARLRLFLRSQALKDRRRKLYLFPEPSLSSELSATDSGSCWKNPSWEKCQHQTHGRFYRYMYVAFLWSAISQWKHDQGNALEYFNNKRGTHILLRAAIKNWNLDPPPENHLSMHLIPSSFKQANKRISSCFTYCKRNSYWNS